MTYKVTLDAILGEMPDRQLESLRQQIVEEQRMRKDMNLIARLAKTPSAPTQKSSGR